MKLLGAVLAGGASRRFGSDKALALWRGEPLIAHAVRSLAQEAAEVVVCGREWGGLVALPDRPAPGVGPLGGLAAALHYACQNDFDTVLTSGCDLLDLPGDLAARRGPAPAVAEGQPLLALWPATLADALDAHLAAGHRSLRSWVAATGARSIDLGTIRNVNTPGDLPD